MLPELLRVSMSGGDKCLYSLGRAQIYSRFHRLDVYSNFSELVDGIFVTKHGLLVMGRKILYLQNQEM